MIQHLINEETILKYKLTELSHKRIKEGINRAIAYNAKQLIFTSLDNDTYYRDGKKLYVGAMCLWRFDGLPNDLVEIRGEAIINQYIQKGFRMKYATFSFLPEIKLNMKKSKIAVERYRRLNR